VFVLQEVIKALKGRTRSFRLRQKLGMASKDSISFFQALLEKNQNMR